MPDISEGIDIQRKNHNYGHENRLISADFAMQDTGQDNMQVIDLLSKSIYNNRESGVIPWSVMCRPSR